ncbi:MAG: TRAP transporter large permease [Vulcanimicrobiaceae bacterium]
MTLALSNGTEIALVVLLMFALMGIGIPIFISIGIAALVGLDFFFGPHQALIDFASFLWQGLNTFELVAIPLFVYTGMLIKEARIGDDLFDFARVWFGSFNNGLGIAVIFACAIFAAICGSSPVTAVTIGLVALPVLARDGYSDGSRGGLVAAGGTLGILFPPSIPLIIYGVITQTSIGRLFIGTLIPGILLAVLFALYVGFIAKPAVRSAGYTWGERWSAIRRGLPVVMLPVLIIGSIYLGLITPTETGAVAVLYVLVLGVVKGRLKPYQMARAALSGALTSSMLLMIFGFGIVFARYSGLMQVPQDLARTVAHVQGGPLITFTGLVIAYVIMGTFLESGAMTVLTIPIFFPIATAIGLDPIQFGVMAAVNQEIAQIHPPAGLNLVTVSSISGISLPHVMKSVLPFIGIELVLLYLLYFVPQLTLFLPAHMLR